MNSSDYFGYRMYRDEWYEDGLIAAYGFRGIDRGYGTFDCVATNYCLQWKTEYHLKALTHMLDSEHVSLIDMFREELQELYRKEKLESGKHYTIWEDQAIQADFIIRGGYIHARIGIKRPCDMSKSVSYDEFNELGQPFGMYASYLVDPPKVGTEVLCRTSKGWIQGTVLTYIHADEIWTYGIVYPNDLSDRSTDSPWSLLANFMNTSEIKLLEQEVSA